MSNTIINCPSTTTNTRYLYGTFDVVEKEFKKAKAKGLVDIRGHFADDHVHMTFERTTKYGRLVIDWTIIEEGELVNPVYTVYTAIGSFPRCRRLVAVNEAKEILRNGESTWATIVCPNGDEIHFNLHEGDVGLMLYGSNP